MLLSSFTRLSVLFIALIAGQLAFGDCGGESVSVRDASAFELQSSCQSLSKVVSLFKIAGVEISPRFKLFFEEQAEVLFGEEIVPVHGYFDDETFEMHITRFENPKNKDLTPFGLSWNLAQATSYVLHEMTHLVVATDLALHQRKLKREWHEFVAYAVQIELMDSNLKQSVLNRYSETAAFENPNAVNAMIYEMDPDTFAVKAYKSMKAWGGAEFLKKLLQGEIPVALKIVEAK